MSTGTEKPMPDAAPVSDRIAGIDRRVGLNYALDDAAGGRRQAPAEGADDARGQRPRQSERVADGEHALADPEVGRAPDGDRFQQRAGLAEPDHGEIVIGRGADDGGVDRLAVVEPDRDPARTLDHVMVGHHMARPVPDEARPRAAPPAAAVAGEYVDH
jgi:hypothetical protein